MRVITINVSEELYDTLALIGANEDKSPSQVLTEKVDLYFEFKRLLNKMVKNE